MKPRWSVALSACGILCLTGLGDVRAETIDPQEVANRVKRGELRFDAKRQIVVTLEENQTYTIVPVFPEPEHRYVSATMFSASQSGPPGHPLPPPLPPRPWPPIPGPDHGGTPPPKPPKPGVPNPTPPKPSPPNPKNLIQEYSDSGVIVGRLQTDGVKTDQGSLAKGAYTTVLTKFQGKPVAALIDESGNYVLSSSNFFLVDSPERH